VLIPIPVFYDGLLSLRNEYFVFLHGAGPTAFLICTALSSFEAIRGDAKTSSAHEAEHASTPEPGVLDSSFV
jgi:hypothetical protein